MIAHRKRLLSAVLSFLSHQSVMKFCYDHSCKMTLLRCVFYSMNCQLYTLGGTLG